MIRLLHSCLKSLQEHEKLQHAVFHRLCGCNLIGCMYFFEIVHCYSLVNPMPIQAIGTRRTKSFFFTLEDGQVQRLSSALHRAYEDGSVPAWLHQVLQQESDLDFSVCVRLPRPFALLCGRGHWSTFALGDLFQPKSLFRGWSIAAAPQIWDVASMPQPRFDSAEPPNVMDPDVSMSLLEDLRFAAAKMDMFFPAADPGCRAALQRMHTVATSLQGHVYETCTAFRVGEAPRVGNEAYGVYYLINCFLLCDMLKSDADLRATLQLACKIVLPKHVCDAVLKLFQEEDRPVPSKSTISRLRLRVDVSFMLMTRDWLRAQLQLGGVVVHAMVDSSPQGGHDYELLSLSITPKSKLRSLHVDMLRLEHARGKSLQERDDWFDEEQAIMSRIRDAIHLVMAPPALLGLGKGRSTLALKFRATVHAMLLLAGTDKRFEEFVSSIQTWVSDLGTESGFANVGRIPLTSLFSFLEARADEDGAEFVLREEEVDFAAEDQATHHVPDVVSVDMGNSLMVPGFLHILRNCFSGLRDCLDSFAEVVDKLQDVARLVGRPESKQRLLNACFSDELGQALSEDIKEFSSFVYDKRWGTVSHCILSILKCEPALRRQWSLERYLNSPGANRVDERDMAAATETQDTVRLTVADEAICSPVWWQYLHMMKTFATLQITLTKWAEGCPCHWALSQNELGEAVTPRLKHLWDSCPLRGRRCAELASGSFWTYVQRLG